MNTPCCWFLLLSFFSSSSHPAPSSLPQPSFQMSQATSCPLWAPERGPVVTPTPLGSCSWGRGTSCHAHCASHLPSPCPPALCTLTHLPGLLGWAPAHFPSKTHPAALCVEGVVDALTEAPPGIPRANRVEQGHLHLFSPLDSLPFHMWSVATFSSTGVCIRPPSSHTPAPRPMRLRTKPSRSHQVGEPAGHPAPWTPATWSVILALTVAA